MIENSDTQAVDALLRWYADMGVDEAISPEPLGLYAWKAKSPPTAPKQESAPKARAKPRPYNDEPATTKVFAPTPNAPSTQDTLQLAQKAAATCASIKELKDAVDAFEGCPLKPGAKNTVFADGVEGAPLLVIGEAPGRDEDQIGKPFAGPSGQLLDRMLASIAHTREENTLVTNIVFWRPPGNRAPTQMESAICRPFVHRLIELSDPKAVLLAGGMAMEIMLGLSSIMRMRGKWHEIETPNGKKYPALPTFHPTVLLRQQANKRLAWEDLLTLRSRLTEG